MVCRIRGLIAVWLIALPGVVWAQADPDAGVEVQASDGAVPRDAGPAADGSALDAGALDAEPAIDLTEPLRRLRRFELALSGSPDLDTPMNGLFGVELTDESAVSARAESIGRELRQFPVDVLSRASTLSSSTAAALDSPRPQVANLIRVRSLQLQREFLLRDRAVRMAQLDAEAARRLVETQSEEAKAQEARAVEKAEMAEAERERALQEAERARTESLRSLNSRRATVARVKTELAQLDQRLATERNRRAQETAQTVKKGQLLVLRAGKVRTSSTADLLFRELEIELEQALDNLSDALTSFRSDVQIPELDLEPPELPSSASDEEKEVARGLREALLAFEAYAEEIQGRESQLRLVSLASWLKHVESLARARSNLFILCSEELRNELTGFSVRTLSEIVLESRTLQLTATAGAIHGAQELGGVGKSLKDLTTLGNLLWTLAKVFFVIALVIWLRRKGPELRSRARRYQLGHLRSISWLRRMATIERQTQRFAPVLLYLLAISFIRVALGPFAQLIALDLALSLATWLGIYWLIRHAFAALVVALAKRKQIRLSAATLREVGRSTRHAALAVLFAGLFNTFAARILGQGVLYYFARQAVIIGLIAVTFFLVRRWRRSIASAYLAVWPEGTLARLVEAKQDTFYGVGITAAAFVYVLVRGAAELGRESILGFDQSRKALAFLFRKRLERKAEELGDWEGQVEALPPRLRQTFSLKPLANETLRVDHFPDFDRLELDLAAWRAQKIKGSFLLRGSRGFGKSTWIHRATEISEDLNPCFVSLQRSYDLDPVAPIATALGFDGVKSVERLVSELNSGERRMVVLDDVHNLYLREIGGIEPLSQLMEIIEDTGDQVFWLATADELTWRHVSAVAPQRARFRTERKLGNWSEEDIRQLLMARAVASGIVHQFEDLVVDDTMSGDAIARTGESYTRLIWDYADGCPLVALHYWLQSLAPVDQERVRVRLFKAPDAERLERIPEEARFLYAAVAMHETLSSEEAARVLRKPIHFCEVMLIRGEEEGLLTETEDGRYALAVHWYRAIVRFLRRKHMIS